MDYDAAKNMAALFNPVPLEIVCYHCQQAAEKILKAYSIAQGEPLIKTHDLRIIMTQCISHDESFNSLSVSCSALTDYAVITRYPIGEDSVTEHDMKTALRNAAEIMDFTKDKLERLGFK
jgi:HEPN domain-containing protein